MNKKLIVICYLGLLIVSLIPLGSHADEGINWAWTIDGDEIYVNNSKAYISCTPHTLNDSGWVTFTVISKTYGGSVDVGFGIDKSKMTPKHPQFWNGNKWKPLNKQFEKINKNYQNFDKWFLMKDVNVNQGQEYKFRIYLETIPGSTGKYFFGIKKSNDPISQGLWLDPWWQNKYKYRQNITIDHNYIQYNLSGFPVGVTIPKSVGDLCNNGDSIRFLNETETGLLPFEIEGSWNTTGDNICWVNLTKIYNYTDTKFVMYFGNSNVKNGQNSTDVWDDDFGAVYHMNSTWDSTIGTFHGINRDGMVDFNYTGLVGGCGRFVESENDYIQLPSGLSHAPKYTLEAHVKHTGKINNEEKFIVGVRDDYKYQLMIEDNISKLWHNPVTGSTSKASAPGLVKTPGTWFHIYGRYDNWINASRNTSTGSGITLTSPEAGAGVSVVGTGTSRNEFYNGYIDEIRIHKTNRNNSWMNATFHNFYTAGFLTYDSVEALVGVSPPSSFSSVGLTVNSINVSWVTGKNATHTYIRYSTSNFPNSRTDGTFLVNTTDEYYIHTVPDNTKTYYYSAWGYNSSQVTPYSEAYSTNSSTVKTGSVTINCYEANTTNPLTFNIFVKNKQGTQTYTKNNCSNPSSISISLMPYGVDTAIKISANGSNEDKYQAAWFYRDIVLTQEYVINAYLHKVNATHLYAIDIVDEYSNYIDKAKVTIQKVIDGSYITIYDILTDGAGRCTAWLEAGDELLVIVSKDGYATSYNDWIPDPIYFGLYYPKTFKINATVPETEYYTFWDIIDFDATMYTNGIQVNYSDSFEETTDATFYTFETFNYSTTLVSTNSTTNDDFSFWVTNINTSRQYIIVVHLNHTTLGYQIQSVVAGPLYPSFDIWDIELKYDNALGNFELPMTHVLYVYLPAIVLLVVFGALHAGLGAVGCGMYLSFAYAIFEGLPTGVIMVAPLIIVLGFVLIYIKGGAAKV